MNNQSYLQAYNNMGEGQVQNLNQRQVPFLVDDGGGYVDEMQIEHYNDPTDYYPMYFLTGFGYRPYQINDIIGDISPEEVHFTEYKIFRQGDQQNKEVRDKLELMFQDALQFKDKCFTTFYQSNDYNKGTEQNSREQNGPIHSFTEYQKLLYQDEDGFSSILHWEALLHSQQQIKQKIATNPALNGTAPPQSPAFPTQPTANVGIPAFVPQNGTFNFGGGQINNLSNLDSLLGPPQPSQQPQEQFNQQPQPFDQPNGMYDQPLASGGYPQNGQPMYEGASMQNQGFPQHHQGFAYGQLGGMDQQPEKMMRTQNGYGGNPNYFDNGYQDQQQDAFYNQQNGEDWYDQNQNKRKQSEPFMQSKRYVDLPIYESDQHKTIESRISKEHDKLFKKYNEIDVCFLIDATNSMQNWIDGIRNQINQTVNILRQEICRFFPDNIQVAFICYRDKDEEGTQLTEMLDFTKNTTEFANALGQVRAYGGSDIPEDVISGIELVSTLSWSKHAFKVLCHIADAPCHGLNFHSFPTDDNYPYGDYRGRSIILELTKLYDAVEIENYQFFHVDVMFTSKMIEEFREQCSRRGIDYHWFQEIPNISDQGMGLIIARSAIMSYTKSLSSVSTTVEGGPSGSRRKIMDSNQARNIYNSKIQNSNQGGTNSQSTLFKSSNPSIRGSSRQMSQTDTGTPTTQKEKESDFQPKKFLPIFEFDQVNWKILQATPGINLFCECPPTIEGLLEKISDKKKIDQYYYGIMKLRIHRSIFSKSGACRNPYYALQQHSEKGDVPFVVKQFKSTKIQSIEYYIQQMEISVIAEFMRRKFEMDCRKKLNYLSFRFVRCTVFMDRTYRIDKDSQIYDPKQIYNLEHLLPANSVIEKFNTNFGHINPKANPMYNEYLQSFSHWTYVKSKETFVIVDLQGAMDEKTGTMLLTDPAIHCPSDKSRFARTNLGKPGIVEFLKSHRCNQYCQKLNIFDPKLRGRIASSLGSGQDSQSTGYASIVNEVNNLGFANYLNIT